MKNIALFENTIKPDAYKYAQQAASKLLDKGFSVYVRESLAAKFTSELKNYVKIITLDKFEKYVDAIMTFGGDGTVLSAAREMINKDIPVMGFNLGKLGFLAEFTVDEIEKSIDNLANGDYRIVDRSCIETVIDGEVIYALNDFVIEKKCTPRLITLKTYADNHFIADYRADGLIITTPTGSTAYSLSCHGPVIPPTANVICLTPVSPHTMTLRPLVLPDSSIITIQIDSPSGEAGFVADGVVERVLKNGDTIEICQKNAKVKMIKPNNMSYFDLLRKKLLWAQHPSTNEG